MDSRPIFDLGPERLNRLLSLGKEEPETDANPASEAPAPTPESDGATEQPGSWIGPYRLARMLGEGGMGIVYLAEQEHPIERQVALKVIKPGMDSRRVIARFQAERQTLARLDHPNIAHVHDAGTTESGRPYFVMEYVEGLPITEYFDRNKLSIKDRLCLFMQVCQAIHHAHQKGFIHRDIKPSNILVTGQDGQAAPKVIDFGVARALSQSLTQETLFTQLGQLVGTPEYMSPERIDLANETADTRSDVYSLGVLLYVLLAGALPFESDVLRERGLEHLRQIIREQDPKTPSTRLIELGEAAATVAESRRTEVAALVKRLHTELEWIPLKAMEKSHERRYQSAAELAEDVAHYLNGSPLLAGPPSALYLLRKFSQRNRILVGAATLVLAVMIAGTVVSTLFAVEARRQVRTTAAINTFFNENLLGSLSPLKSTVGEITVVSVLDMAAQNLEDQFNNDPLVEASIHQTLANSYRELGKLEAAQGHQDRALQLRHTHLGPGHPETLQSQYAAVQLCRLRSGSENASELAIQTLEAQRRVLGSAHLSTLKSMNILGRIYMDKGEYAEAQSLLEEAANIARDTVGEKEEITLLISGNLAHTYRQQGLLRETEVFVESLLPLYEETWGAEHPNTLDQLHLLGMLYSRHANPGDAEPIFLKELELKSRVLGDRHMRTLEVMYSLTKLYGQQGRYEEAEAMALRTLKIATEEYGEGTYYPIGATYRLAFLRMQQKRYAEAEPLFSQALRGWQKRKDKENHPAILKTKNSLGFIYTEQGFFDKAEPLLVEAYEGRNATLGADHPGTLWSANDLGTLYLKQGRYAEAEPLLLQAVEGRRLMFGADHPDTLESLSNLVTLYQAWNKPDEGAEWRARLPAKQAVEE